MPTLVNEKLLEGSEVTAHRKDDVDNSLAQKKTKREFEEEEKMLDQEEKGNSLKNFIKRNKDEIKMIYNFHDGL